MDRYEIEIKEQLDVRWLRRFEGLTLRHLPDGRTLLAGELPDHAALTRIRDLGLTLLRVQRIAPPPGGPTQIPLNPIGQRRIILLAFVTLIPLLLTAIFGFP